jgi:hypothetical protein
MLATRVLTAATFTLVTAAGSDTIRTRALRPQTGNACPLTPVRFSGHD